MSIKKSSGGVEDLTFGLGVEHQTRRGSLVQITQINSDTIPHSAVRTIKAQLDYIDSKIAQYDNSLTASVIEGLVVKVATIEENAEVNNISDVDAVDLTDSGESTLHYHASDRDRANHTGTQTASTISDFVSAVQASETTTSLTLVANILSYTDEDGTVTNHDLSLYLDDTNLARITAGVYNAPTQELIFTRDDETTFTIDASMFFDDTNLVTTVDGQAGAVDLSTVYEPLNINIVKYNVTGEFSKPQGSVITAGANALNLTGSNLIRFTATAANITVGTMATKKGQEFSVTIDSAENVTGWGAEFLFAPDFSAVTPTPPATMTGTMEFYMKVVEVNLVDGGTANKIHVAWAS